MTRTITVHEAQDFVYRELAKARSGHHPMPLAIVLQFWQGDRFEALSLARLLADIEPKRRDDVLFVLAVQENCPLEGPVWETAMYLCQKFRVLLLQTEVDESKKYPGICFDPWASAAAQLCRLYHEGVIPMHSAFFFEADGCPLSVDWIDQLKVAHEETLAVGKSVTGPRMRESKTYGAHVNGSFIMHLDLWLNRPSLHTCPPTAAWDVFHGRTLVSELGPSLAIANLYGLQGLSESAWKCFAINAAWVTSSKDGLPQHWARRNLVQP